MSGNRRNSQGGYDTCKTLPQCLTGGKVKLSSAGCLAKFAVEDEVATLYLYVLGSNNIEMCRVSQFIVVFLDDLEKQSRKSTQDGNRASKL